MSQNSLDTDIAIIGMACRFPEANSIQKFWRNLYSGKECIHHFTQDELLKSGNNPIEIFNEHYVPFSGIIQGFSKFDAQYFNITESDAIILNPTHRCFLQTSWEALADANINIDDNPYTIGSYGSASPNDYSYYLKQTNDSLSNSKKFKIQLYNQHDTLVSLTAYKLNLQGPAINAQSTCSSALTSLHLAIQGLLTNDCNVAIVGGATMRFPHYQGYLWEEGFNLSRDGHCYPFDSRASGTIPSSGVGAIVLKTYEDALKDKDPIYAIIKSSAINNDGNTKVNFTAPSVDQQAKIIAEAIAIANCNPTQLSYIEAHGTGTSLGDPIEFQALKQSFNCSEKQRNFCALGSVKANIGHLDAAAGIAGLIKLALLIYHKKIPPQINFSESNSAIDFTHSPFYIPTQSIDLSSSKTPIYAGISALGIGGTNVHMILQSAPKRNNLRKKTIVKKPFILKDYCVKPKTTITNNYKESIPRPASIPDTIRNIMFQLLGNEINDDTHFFEAGGDSLLAVQLCAELDKKFSCSLPIRWVYSHPTISSQINYFNQPPLDQIPPYNPLIKLTNHSSNKVNLFLIHPGMVGIEAYHAFIKRIDKKVSLYGIDSYNLYHLDDPIQSISALTDYYLAQIKLIQPKGPYYLGGWSLGGVIAAVMNEKLIENDEKVAQLILLDSYLFTAEDLLMFRQLSSEFRQLASSMSNHLNRLLPNSELQQRLFEIETNLLEPYPYTPYAGNVLLFQARNAFTHPFFKKFMPEIQNKIHSFTTAQLAKTNNGWSEIFLNIKTVMIDTNHHDLLNENNLPKIISYINKNL